MLNHVVVMGRLVKDPELRRLPNGTPVANFVLACDRDFKAEGADRECDFIEVIAWRSNAEFVCKYFVKGKMAIAEGRLQSRNWTDKDGNKRKAYEVCADHIHFGSDKKADPYQAAASPSVSAPPAGEFALLEDDTPLPW